MLGSLTCGSIPTRFVRVTLILYARRDWPKKCVRSAALTLPLNNNTSGLKHWLT